MQRVERLAKNLYQLVEKPRPCWLLFFCFLGNFLAAQFLAIDAPVPANKGPVLGYINLITLTLILFSLVADPSILYNLVKILLLKSEKSLKAVSQ
jgi:hypothetical protein